MRRLLFVGANGRSDRKGTVVVNWLIYKGMVMRILGLPWSSLVGGAHVHFIFDAHIDVIVITVI